MPNKVKIKLVYADGTDYEYWTFPGVNLWHSMAAQGIDVAGSCGGKGTCGKCKVRIEGLVTPLSDSESQFLLAEEVNTGERLACYCYVEEAIVVYLDYGQFSSDAKVRVFMELGQYQFNPRFRLSKIFIQGLDNENPVPLQRRIKQALPEMQIQLTNTNWNNLAKLDRAGRPTLELYALFYDKKLVNYIGRDKKTIYGVALDVGSTSLFAALMDLTNGKVLAIASKTNMQRVYGNDIISRISYCLENTDGLIKLHQVLINSINTLVEELLQESTIELNELFEYVIVGNPVMLHFLLGISPNGFAVAPYSGIIIDELNLRAQELKIIANENTRAYILPQAGGFIGADVIAGLLTLKAKKTGAYLFIDIGTNGEIVLCRNEQLWATSAAAGPAFEGGGISSGARAGIAVIDKVDIDAQGELHYHIPGNQAARGICGSALIDLIAVLLKLGYINEKGIITPEAGNKLHIRDSSRGQEIVLMEGGAGSPLVFNQEDIRQIQLAKAALATAIDILLEKAGIDYRDLDEIYLAGTFGNYISPENAILIKMLPPVEPSKIINLGNTAAQGAMLALLYEAKRQEARSLQDKIDLVELTLHPGFQKKYINNLNF